MYEFFQTCNKTFSTFQEWPKLRADNAMYQMTGVVPASDMVIQGYTSQTGYITKHDTTNTTKNYYKYIVPFALLNNFILSKSPFFFCEQTPKY